MATIHPWHAGLSSQVGGGRNCTRVLLTGPSQVAKIALSGDLWAVLACQHQPLGFSKAPEMDISASCSILVEAVILRDPKGVQRLYPKLRLGFTGLHMLHTKAGCPTAPWQP